jgi:hypothetical protein
MKKIEEHSYNTIHFLACEYNVTLKDISDKVASEVYNICSKLEK